MEQQLPQRKRIRLPKYDYSSTGLYFITICTKDKRCVLGTVVGQELAPAEITLSAVGRIAEEELHALIKRFPHLNVDKYCIMPNHIHMILGLVAARASPRPTQGIPQIIGTFKSITTRRKNGREGMFGRSLWQTSYYDHIIRNDADYLRIWQYIDSNPAKWVEDKYYMA